jgi:hypothetical protein
MEEIATIIKEIPSDRAPRPDGFNGCFYKAAWDIIKVDVAAVFTALWNQDTPSLFLLNGATMVLLHNVGKLFSKGLVMRLAPRMHELVKVNQIAFIKGRWIHENFRSVQLTCHWLHAKKSPAILLKVDLAKVRLGGLAIPVGGT